MTGKNLRGHMTSVFALVYGMTVDFRYNEQKVLVYGKEQGYIPNRHTKVLQVKAP